MDHLKAGLAKLRSRSPSRTPPAPNPPSNTTRNNDGAAALSTEVAQKIKASTIWQKACQNIEQSDEWKKFQELVKRRKLDDNLSTKLAGPQSGGATASLQQIQPLSADFFFEISQAVGHQQDEKTSPFTAGLKTCRDNVTDVLIKVNDAGAAAAAFNPYAALAWSLVQFVATAAQNRREVRELCMENLPHMVELAEQYQTFEEIYQESSSITKTKKMMETVLENLFTSILQFQVVVVILTYSRMMKAKSAFGPSSESLPQKSLDDIDQFKKDLQEIQHLVDREINTAQHKELQVQTSQIITDIRGVIGTLQRLEDISNETYKIVTAEYRTKVLEYISPLKYETAHDEKKRQEKAGTADWLFQHDDYKLWNQTNSQNVLWLNGFMGSGKSCLVHALIENQKTLATGEGSLAYFYCDASTEAKKEEIAQTSNILRSYVKQFAASAPETSLPSDITGFYDLHISKGFPTSTDCEDLLKIATNAGIPKMFILDGLDECSAEVQDELIQSLRLVMENAQRGTRLMVASRDEPAIRTLLDGFANLKITVNEHNTESIQLMIDASVADAMSNSKTKFLYSQSKKASDEATVESRVKMTLKQKAGGMFRWVQMSLDFLHASRSPPQMVSRLEAIDKAEKLFDLYDTMWNINMDEIKDYGARVVETVLLFMVFGRMPGYEPYGNARGQLEDNRIKSNVISIQAGSLAENGKFDDNLLTEHILRMFPGFIVAKPFSLFVHDIALNPKEIVFEVLEIPHVSVTQYLQERRSDVFSAANGHAALANLCMNIFTTIQLPIGAGCGGKDFIEYAGLSWLHHLIMVRRSLPKYDDFPAYVTSNAKLGQSLSEFLLVSPPSAAFIKACEFAKPLKGGALEFIDDYGNPPIATSPPSTLAARLLLDYEWDCNDLPDAELKSSFVTVSEHGHWETGGSVLAFATWIHHAKAIRWFHQKGLETSQATTVVGNRSLCEIACTDLVDCRLFWLQAKPADSLETVLNTLIDCGMDVSNREGWLGFCCTITNPEYSPKMRELFEKNGLDVFQKHDLSGSALELAVSLRQINIVKDLLPRFLQNDPDKKFLPSILKLIARWPESEPGLRPEDVGQLYLGDAKRFQITELFRSHGFDIDYHSDEARAYRDQRQAGFTLNKHASRENLAIGERDQSSTRPKKIIFDFSSKGVARSGTF